MAAINRVEAKERFFPPQAERAVPATRRRETGVRRNDHPSKLFFLHWDGTNMVTRASITLSVEHLMEHVTFAPMTITP
jgi:hypothetical protein